MPRRKRCETMNISQPATVRTVQPSIGRRTTDLRSRQVIGVRQQAWPAPHRKPSPVPLVIPFVVMAFALMVIYVGLLMFPTVKTLLNQQDCVASGRSDCYPRP